MRSSRLSCTRSLATEIFTSESTIRGTVHKNSDWIIYTERESADSLSATYGMQTGWTESQTNTLFSKLDSDPPNNCWISPGTYHCDVRMRLPRSKTFLLENRKWKTSGLLLRLRKFILLVSAISKLFQSNNRLAQKPATIKNVWFMPWNCLGLYQVSSSQASNRP